MLTIHHLGVSQSERIIWLCEELGIPYDLKVHKRDPLFSPASLKNVPGNEIGTAPVIQDGDLTMTESGAIVEYIIHKHGGGRLSRKPSDAEYANYLKFLHFANASLQSQIGRLMLFQSVGVDSSNDLYKRQGDRLQTILRSLDRRLGVAKYLAGDELSGADIMVVFSLSTMRYFYPFDLNGHHNIVRYLKAISEREAYQRAMHKGDEGMPLLMTGDPPKQTFFEQMKNKQS